MRWARPWRRRGEQHCSELVEVLLRRRMMGFAIGLNLKRLAVLKHGLDDIRSKRRWQVQGEAGMLGWWPRPNAVRQELIDERIGQAT